MGTIILAIIITFLLYYALIALFGALFRGLFKLVWIVIKFAFGIIFYPIGLLCKLLFCWMD